MSAEALLLAAVSVLLGVCVTLVILLAITFAQAENVE
jgi:hypothetical protein